MNRVLDRLGYPTHQTEAYKYFVGEGIEKLVYRVLPLKARDDKSVSDCVAAMRKEYDCHWKDRTVPYDGIETMLSELVRRQIKLAVLSNKPHRFTEMTVSHYFPKWHFDEIAGAVTDIPRKPDPAGALRIIEKMKIPAENFLFLGDSGIDMKTANSAGIYAIGALWGFRTENELLESGAKKLISQPEGILNLIG